MKKIPKPAFSRTAFWDVDFDAIDWEKHARFVVEKVLNFGLWSDVLLLFQHYGFERVKLEAQLVPYLKKKSLSFCCAVFDLPPEAFRCYTRQRSSPVPWNY